jgi:hypothetical protein
LIYTKLRAKVLELPGFPVIIKGILFIKHVKIAKIFSFRGVFCLLPYGISVLSKNREYSSSKI